MRGRDFAVCRCSGESAGPQCFAWPYEKGERRKEKGARIFTMRATVVHVKGVWVKGAALELLLETPNSILLTPLMLLSSYQLFIFLNG